MKCYSWKICAVVLLVVAVAVSAKKKTKYEGDFEFVDEVSAKRDDKEGLLPLSEREEMKTHASPCNRGWGSGRN